MVLMVLMALMVLMSLIPTPSAIAIALLTLIWQFEPD